MKIKLHPPYSFCQMGMRGNQEDARYPDCDAAPANAPAYVVCDGVGGQDAGEVASNAVCAAVADYMGRKDLCQPIGVEDMQGCLSHAYARLLQEVERTGCDKMATTLTMVCFHADGATMMHMGDSRIYQLRPGEGIVYKSLDHSLANQLVDEGKLSPDDAETFPQSNFITRCLMFAASERDLQCATAYTTPDVSAGDYFVLCSDGVLHCIDDDKLFALVTDRALTDKEKIEALAKMCAESADNNTAYLLHVDSVEKDDIERAASQLPETAEGAAPSAYGRAYLDFDVVDVLPRMPKKSIWKKIGSLFK